jgi:hypothetical protein
MPISPAQVLIRLKQPTDLVAELINLIDTQLADPSKHSNMILTIDGCIMFNVVFHSRLNIVEQHYLKDAYEKAGWTVGIHTNSSDRPTIIELTAYAAPKPIPTDKWTAPEKNPLAIVTY